MDRVIFANKYLSVTRFKNPDGDKMFSLQFLVDEASDSSYRGFPIKRAKKVAKWLKQAAKAIKGL